jgi:hypothetical protein
VQKTKKGLENKSSLKKKAKNKILNFSFLIFNSFLYKEIEQYFNK